MNWRFPAFNTQKGILVPLGFPLLFLNAWLALIVLDYFQSVIRIFILATLTAFILGYPTRWLLARFPLTRPLAVVFVLVGAGLILGGLASVLIPTLIEQVNQFLPYLGETHRQALEGLEGWSLQWRLPANLRSLAEQASEKLPDQLQTVLSQILGLAVGAAGGLLEAGFILVITIYLLLRGEEFWDGLYRWLPRRWRQPLRESLRRSFQNYYIGQAAVSSLLGGSLTLAFTLLQVPFGLLFGLLVGVMAFFPFGGATGIILISLAAALQSLWLGVKVLAVATLLDQLIENILAPKLLGKFTGVHPVWVLLSLMIGGRIAGLLGILVAVPLAGALQDLLNAYYAQRRDDGAVKAAP